MNNLMLAVVDRKFTYFFFEINRGNYGGMSPGKLRGDGVFMLRRKSSGKSAGDSQRSSMHVTPEKDVKVNREWPTVCSVGGCGNAR
jgi:hypothetical protein